MNLKTGSISTLFVETEVQEIVWLSETTILYSNSTTEGIPGGLELWVTDITDLTKRWVSYLVYRGAIADWVHC